MWSRATKFWLFFFFCSIVCWLWGVCVLLYCDIEVLSLILRKSIDYILQD